MSYSVKRPRCKQFFRVMRITTLLLFVFNFCMHAENSSSQNVNVTIKRSNTELENVLNDIEKQTDYLFIYNKFVNVDRKVSVNLKKASLEEVLANLFAGTDVNTLSMVRIYYCPQVEQRLRSLCLHSRVKWSVV